MQNSKPKLSKETAALITRGIRILPIILLVVLLSMYISIRAERTTLNKRLLENQTYLASRLNVELSSMTKRFDEFKRYSSQDAGGLLSDMRMYAYTADALNTALVSAYGEGYSVFSRSTYTRIATLLNDCERAFKNGLTPTQIINDLSELMGQVNVAASERFTPNGEIIPKPT